MVTWSYEPQSHGLGWGLSEADGSLIIDNDNEWIQPETITNKVSRLEARIKELEEKIEELEKMFWH